MIRGALAAIHNFETLLKSPRVPAGVLTDLYPELLQSCAALRSAVDGARPLDLFVHARIGALESALRAAFAGGLDAKGRLGLEQVTSEVNADVDAAAELLDLAARAAHPANAELSVDALTTQSLAMAAGTGQGKEPQVAVYLDTKEGNCLVFADAQVIAMMIALAVASVHASGAEEITLRARCDATEAKISVEPSIREGAAGRVLAHLTRRIAPSDDALREAAQAIGANIDVNGPTLTLRLPRI